MAVQVSRSCSGGNPEMGPRLDNGKWRALLGWNHFVDTADGIKDGKIWCWVSGPPEKFQVYDQNFNRGEKGKVRDCGVANFTMVRMFHPYWCLRTGGGIVLSPPRDGEWVDKAHCRAQYMELIQRHRIALGLPVDEIPEEYARRLVDENKEPNVGAKRRRARQKGQAKRLVSITLPAKGRVPGGATADLMCVDDSDRDNKISKSLEDRVGEDSVVSHVRQLSPGIFRNSMGNETFAPTQPEDLEHDKVQASCNPPSPDLHTRSTLQQVPLSCFILPVVHEDADMVDTHEISRSTEKPTAIFTPDPQIKDEVSDAHCNVIRVTSHFSERMLEGLVNDYPIIID